MTSIADQNTLRSDISARCPSTMDGLQCELIRRHDGLHAAEITRDEDGHVDGAVTWTTPANEKPEDAVPAVGSFELVIMNMADDQLLLHRQMLLARRRQVLDEISATLFEVEAEVQKRIDRNGGRAILAHEEGIIITAEIADQYTPWVYDVAGLREVSKMLPEKEAAKVVKHVEEQHTVIAAHDEPGNARSIEALINKYGLESEIGKKLAACRQRSHTGRKLTITAEGAR